MSDTGKDLVKVRILTETHEHEGKRVPKGAVLDVSPRTAQHFVEVKAAELVGSASATKATGGVE